MKYITYPSHYEANYLSLTYTKVMSELELNTIEDFFKEKINKEKDKDIIHIKNSEYPLHFKQRLNLFKEFKQNDITYEIDFDTSDVWYLFIKEGISLTSNKLSRMIKKNNMLLIIPLDGSIIIYDGIEKVDIKMGQCYLCHNTLDFKFNMRYEQQQILLITYEIKLFY